MLLSCTKSAYENSRNHDERGKQESKATVTVHCIFISSINTMNICDVECVWLVLWSAILAIYQERIWRRFLERCTFDLQLWNWVRTQLWTLGKEGDACVQLLPCPPALAGLMVFLSSGMKKASQNHLQRKRAWELCYQEGITRWWSPCHRSLCAKQWESKNTWKKKNSS